MAEAARQTANAPPKTAKSPRNGQTIPLGAHPGNTGGKKGRSGRRPVKFSAFLKSLRDKPEVQEAIEDAATDADSKGFQAVLRVMADYDTDRPADKHQIVGPIEVRVRVVKEGKRTTAS